MISASLYFTALLNLLLGPRRLLFDIALYLMRRGRELLAT